MKANKEVTNSEWKSLINDYLLSLKKSSSANDAISGSFCKVVDRSKIK